MYLSPTYALMAILNHETMKKIILSSALIISSASMFAQLFVRPTQGGTSTDSYVYVKNEIIYVKGEVNLEKNAGGNTEASVYLRNGGQLIQGGTTSTNTGNGFLSVQQNTKPTNAFGYYYWSSPVGNPTLSNSGNTNFGLGSLYEDKNLVVGEGTNAVLSATTSDPNGFNSPLTISRRWAYMLTTPGTEAAGNWTRINATNVVPPGFGFTMKGVNTGTSSSNTATTTLDQTYEFRGRPNNGNFPIPVAPTAASGPGVVMTLTGNPYPSALDLNKLFNDPDNAALGAIYYYDEDRTKMSHNYSGKPFGYGTWVPGGIDPSPNGNPSTYPGLYTSASFYIWNQAGNQTGPSTGVGTIINNKRFAPIGQGFMFVGKSTLTGSATVTIKNSHRVFRPEGAANYSVFQRTDGGLENSTISAQYTNQTNDGGPTLSTNPTLDNRDPQLRLYVVFDNALTRDLLLAFSPQATDDYDRGFDGISPLGLQSDAYFPIGTGNQKMPYVIQGTNFEASKHIPITFKLHKTSRIEVRAIEEIKKPYQQAYLFDQQENILRPLVKAHTLAGAFTLPAGTYEDRFYIVFRERGGDRPAGQLDPQAEVAGNVDFFQNNPERQLEIRNPEGYVLKSASVYDMSGKLVISENNLGDNSSYSFYTGNLSDGVYLVKLITSDDVAIDSKAVVVNK